MAATSIDDEIEAVVAIKEIAWQGVAQCRALVEAGVAPALRDALVAHRVAHGFPEPAPVSSDKSPAAASPAGSPGPFDFFKPAAARLAREVAGAVSRVVGRCASEPVLRDAQLLRDALVVVVPPLRVALEAHPDDARELAESLASCLADTVEQLATVPRLRRRDGEALVAVMPALSRSSRDPRRRAPMTVSPSPSPA